MTPIPTRSATRRRCGFERGRAGSPGRCRAERRRGPLHALSHPRQGHRLPGLRARLQPVHGEHQLHLFRQRHRPQAGRIVVGQAVLSVARLRNRLPQRPEDDQGHGHQPDPAVRLGYPQRPQPVPGLCEQPEHQGRRAAQQLDLDAGRSALEHGAGRVFLEPELRQQGRDRLASRDRRGDHFQRAGCRRLSRQLQHGHRPGRALHRRGRQAQVQQECAGGHADHLRAARQPICPARTCRAGTSSTAC